MAIFRGKLPIPGPFDIRIGLPRGKQYDPKRAKELFENKPNTNTTINRFRSMVAGAEGFYRPAKFLVMVEFPKSTFRRGEDFAGFEHSEYLTDSKFLTDLQNSMKERLFFFCNAASLPERTITDTSATAFYGPERNMARGLEFATMNLTFMLDSELSERSIFEAWQNTIVNQRTYNLNFYDEYVGKILIFPLHENTEETASQKSSSGPAGSPHGASGPMANLTLAGYYIELLEAYPKTVAAVDLAYNNSSAIANQQITFNYRYWRSSASLRNAEDTSASGDIDGTGVLTESRYGGPFAGIINKLPPEIRRAGRDVFNQVKTKFPTGRIFGGKVFPPFF